MCPEAPGGVFSKKIVVQYTRFICKKHLEFKLKNISYMNILIQADFLFYATILMLILCVAL